MCRVEKIKLEKSNFKRVQYNFHYVNDFQILCDFINLYCTNSNHSKGFNLAESFL